MKGPQNICRGAAFLKARKGGIEREASYMDSRIGANSASKKKLEKGICRNVGGKKTSEMEILPSEKARNGGLLGEEGHLVSLYHKS